MSGWMNTLNSFLFPCQSVGSIGLRMADIFSRRCHFPVGTLGRSIWVSAGQRAPECRRSRQWGWGQGLPRRRTWTSHTRGQYRQAGRTDTVGNGKAQSWCQQHRYRGKWCRRFLQQQNKMLKEGNALHRTSVTTNVYYLVLNGLCARSHATLFPAKYVLPY